MIDHFAYMNYFAFYVIILAPARKINASVVCPYGDRAKSEMCTPTVKVALATNRMRILLVDGRLINTQSAVIMLVQ